MKATIDGRGCLNAANLTELTHKIIYGRIVRLTLLLNKDVEGSRLIGTCIEHLKFKTSVVDVNVAAGLFDG